jgi:hypothetical protein
MLGRGASGFLGRGGSDGAVEGDYAELDYIRQPSLNRNGQAGALDKPHGAGDVS